MLFIICYDNFWLLKLYVLNKNYKHNYELLFIWSTLNEFLIPCSKYWYFCGKFSHTVMKNTNIGRSNSLFVDGKCINALSNPFSKNLLTKAGYISQRFAIANKVWYTNELFAWYNKLTNSLEN